jgi:4-amino-4-deoxy-L-arabinose transferase-like glycosyltransferase
MKKEKKNFWQWIKNNFFRDDEKEQRIFFMKHKHLYFVIGAVIIIGAFCIRAYHLSYLPPGVYPDEAVNGTDAINAIETGHFRLFYANNYGREGLFMNLIALGFMLFGVSVITLKMWSVFFGTLTVLGIILLAREMLNSRRAGLIAGFLYATTFWAINFNRISFRANMLPFVLVFTFFFIFRGLRTGKWTDYLIAGAFFGLGTHTYIAFRIAPLIMIALFATLLISKKGFLKSNWRKILIFALAMFLVALPMLSTFYFHPEYFETRSESVSVFSPKVNQGHLWQALWTSTRLTFGMFNFQGDQNWRHNLPGQPELQSWTGVFFLIGAALLLLGFFYFLFHRFVRKKYDGEFAVVVLLLSWLFAMLLPGLLTYEGLPHALRTIGALPAAILISVYALEKIFLLLEQQKSKYARWIGYVALTTAVLWSGFISTKRYFVDWAHFPEIHAAFAQNFKNMALFLNNLPPSAHKYVIANAGGQIMEDGLPVSAEVVKLLTFYRTPGITYSRPADFDPGSIQAPAKIVLMYYDGEIIAKIKSIFPNALVQKLDPQPGNGTDYYVININ